MIHWRSPKFVEGGAETRIYSGKNINFAKNPCKVRNKLLFNLFRKNF